MPFKIKGEHKTFLRVFITYGIHLWILIFVCNVVIFYSIRFFLKASTTRTANVQPAVEIVEESPVPTEIPTPVPTAVGPVVGLSFSLPGIGTQGGNLKPLHAQRDVTIFLFDPDSNTADKNIKPLYTIKTKVIYNNDPNSLTYTFFVNKYIDLGKLKYGKYQIALQTPQSLRELIKSSDSQSIGGQLFDINDKHFLALPAQAMITGDIYPIPNSDNIMDINDYNMLVSCYNVSGNSSKCPDSSLADLDDNGVVDGIDYNILLANFRTLRSLGRPIPTISIPKPTKPFYPFISAPIMKITNPLLPGPTKAKASPTPITRSSGNSSGGIIIFILFILFLGVAAFVVYKFHLLKILLPKKFEELEAVVEPPSEEQTLVSNENKENTADEVEKSGYLKKVSADNEANGTWVTLADDNGITKGFYPKANIKDGFVTVKGTMKTDDENKPYLFITELNAEG